MVSRVLPESIRFQPLTQTGIWASVVGTFHVVKDACLAGFYKFPMGIGTLVNLYRNPDRPLSEHVPRVQRLCEKVAYLCGLNSTYPHVTEFHLATSPIRFAKVKVPGMEYAVPIPLPQTPVVTRHVIQEQFLVKAMLQHHRYGEYFDGSAGTRIFSDLLRSIFPTFSFRSDDSFLTCGPDFSLKLRDCLVRTLHSAPLNAIIQSETDKLCERWKTYAAEGISFDVTKETKLFTCGVIIRILLGEPRDCQDLSEAVDFINEYIISQIIGIAHHPDEERKIQKAFQIFREMAEEILAKDPPHLFPKNENTGFEMTQEQKRAQLFGMFFAGQATTAFALDHLTSKLALNPFLQEFLRYSIQNGSDLTQIPAWVQFIEKGLLENPPAPAVGRKLAQDVQLSFKTSNGCIAKKRMRRGEGIMHEIRAVSQHLLAEGQANYRLSRASTFGVGRNACLGQGLAMKEINALMSMIVSKFAINTSEKKFTSSPKVTQHSHPFTITVSRT